MLALAGAAAAGPAPPDVGAAVMAGAGLLGEAAEAHPQARVARQGAVAIEERPLEGLGHLAGVVVVLAHEGEALRQAQERGARVPGPGRERRHGGEVLFDLATGAHLAKGQDARSAHGMPGVKSSGTVAGST